MLDYQKERKMKRTCSNSISRLLLVLFFMLNINISNATVQVPFTPELLNTYQVDAEQSSYQGSAALQLKHHYTDGYVQIEGLDFADGEIQVEVAATIDPDLSPEFKMFARGFIGIAFRIQKDPGIYENIYVRPDNARAEDQLRRNHTTQYASSPEYSWKRLRDDSPGKYESYVDLTLNTWTTMRLVVEEKKVHLFIGDDQEPCLVVNDMRLDKQTGGIGVWVGMGTIGYFRNLQVTHY